jgi:hypothetical protein
MDSTICAHLMPLSVRNMECRGVRRGGVRSARRDGSAAFRTPVRGPNRMVRDLESLAMFKFSVYDPLGIAMMGFGVLLVAVLAFVF